MDAQLVDWDGITASPQPNGTLRRRIAGTGAELVRMEIPAGCKAPGHSHPHEQFVQVLAGTGFIETTAGRQAFKAGSVFPLPARHLARGRDDQRHVLVETNGASR